MINLSLLTTTSSPGLFPLKNKSPGDEVGKPLMREMDFLLIFTLQGIPQLLTYNFPVKVTPN